MQLSFVYICLAGPLNESWYGEPRRVLDRGDQGKRGLRTLVLVPPVRFQAVAASARGGVVKRDAGVVDPQEPPGAEVDGIGPARLGGEVERPGARVGVRVR